VHLCTLIFFLGGDLFDLCLAVIIEIPAYLKLIGKFGSRYDFTSFPCWQQISPLKLDLG
jgi:hypothetical protein